ncbi:hypothetical protein Tco_0664311 [Tanacetum coccineum]
MVTPLAEVQQIFFALQFQEKRRHPQWNFFDSISTDPFFRLQWENLFRINELVYRELVREFFATYEFRASTRKNNPRAAGIQFRREIGMAIALKNALMVKNETMVLLFWPTIGDGEFRTRSMVARSIRDPRVRLAHRCIATTILGRKDSTHRITLSDLFFLYCIYNEGVVCNIPFWLAHYLNGVMDGEIIIELVPGQCHWVGTREAHQQHQEHEEEKEEANEDCVGGSAKAYRGISRRDWQAHQGAWMDQQDGHWGQLDTWMTRQDHRYDWMYDHIVRQMHIYPRVTAWRPTCRLTRSLIEILITLPFGYTGHMPPGYDYRYDTAPNGSSRCYLFVPRAYAKAVEVLILYQAYGNLYAMTGGKAHLLEDKQIPSVGVFDEVIWEALGRKACDLGRFGKKLDKNITFQAGDSHSDAFTKCG